MSRPNADRERWWDAHMQEIARGASTAFVLKGASAVLTFALYVVIARLLGPAEAGHYFLALTIVTIAAVIGRLGLDNSVLRFVAAHEADRDWPAVKGVYQRSTRLVLLASVVSTGLVLALATPLSEGLFAKPGLTPALRWMAVAIVPTALLNLQAQGLQGLKRIADSSFVANVSVPLVSLIGALLLAPRWGTVGAVWAYAAASVVTAAVGVWRWRRATRHLQDIPGHFDARTLYRSCIPLFWVSCLQLVIAWSSNVVLGLMATSADVGIFGAAYRTSLLISFVLMAVNSISAPKFAALYQQGDLRALATIARKSARLMALAASPILAVFLVAPHFVMGLFGPEFTRGAAALAILSIGQFVNVVTGSVGWILIMCGYERLLRNNIAICAALSVALNVLLIPRYGYLGAAIATATTLAVQMLVAAVMVWHKLGIVTIPIPGGAVTGPPRSAPRP